MVNIHPIFLLYFVQQGEREREFGCNGTLMDSPNNNKMRRVSKLTFRKRKKKEKMLSIKLITFFRWGVAERCRNRRVGTNLGPLLKLSARLEMQYPPIERRKTTKQTHLKQTITKLAYWNCWARYQLRSSIYLSIYIYKDSPPLPSQKMSLFISRHWIDWKKKKKK